ncbi:MAG: hypothetical protein M1469_09285 [Bacteroidetes bacterium]|nr:hypothetical protein [Bacteroidota bacterium]MCL5268280.1 hypothetical protein [Bacteroidota bacterium]
MTDINLVDIQIKNPSRVITRKYGKRKEATNGADWEWWLISGHRGLGLRVQAKKLDASKMAYRELNKRNPNGRQLDLLIQSANASSPPRFPVYVFYNFWDTHNHPATWNCRSLSMDPTLYGCTIAPATVVRPILGKRKTAQKINRLSYPWHCLVCSRGFTPHIAFPSRSAPDLPTNAFAFLTNAFAQPLNNNEDISSQELDRYVTEKLPPYVYDVLEGREISDQRWETIGTNRLHVIAED